MLREVEIKTAISAMVDGREVLALEGAIVRPLQEFLKGMRFLIDEEPKRKEKPKEAGKKEESKKETSQTEQDILKAWNGGTRTIKEIMEVTGYSYPTVRKYIPETEKG